MIRPILMGLALVAAPALAGPAGMSALPVGSGAPAAHPGFAGGFHNWAPGRHRRPDAGRRHRRGDGNQGAQSYWAGGAALEDYPEPGRGGFFADGEALPTRGGVVYDYDRGYPYDHYRDRPQRTERFADEGTARCSVERVPGRGGPTEIRICRR
jgi:hypothetical protein